MKTILKLIGALLLVVVIVFAVGIFYLDSGIKKAIETYGPEYTQVDVTLGGAHLSVLSGEGSLQGLVVGNPAGFKTANAFSLGEITLSVDISTVMGDPIIIKSLRIIAPEITFEQGRSGTNLQQLQKNIEQAIGADSSSAAGSSEKPGADQADQAPRLIIRELLISGGKIRYSNPLLGGKTIDVPLPEIRLSGIGEKSGGASGAEVIEQLMAAINKSAISAVSQAGALKAVGQQLEQRLQDEKGKLEKTLSGLKGLFGK